MEQGIEKSNSEIDLSKIWNNQAETEIEEKSKLLDSLIETGPEKTIDQYINN